MRPLVFALAVFAGLAAPACAAPSRCPSAPAPAPAAADYVADLDDLLTKLREEYAYSEEHRVDWDALRRRLAPRAREVANRRAFVSLLEEAIDALHDPHANLGTNTAHSFRLVPTDADVWAEVDAGGRAVLVEVRPGSAAARAGLRAGQEIVALAGVPVAEAVAARLGADPGRDPTARGWALRSLLAGRHDEPRRLTVQSASGQREVTLPMEDRPRPARPLDAQRLAGDVGYLAVRNSLGDDALVPAFDAALAPLASCPAIILDLRDTPSGGNTGVAEAILGRFARTAQPYLRFEAPGAGWNGRSRLWQQYVTPRGASYDGRLVVLVDHWTGSMGEGMAVGVDAMGRGVVVGTRMAGLAGAVSTSKLPRTGIRFSYPAERLFHVDGTPRHAWSPPVLVDLVGHDEDGKDPILDRALELLRKSP